MNVIFVKWPNTTKELYDFLVLYKNQLMKPHSGEEIRSIIRRVDELCSDEDDYTHSVEQGTVELLNKCMQNNFSIYTDEDDMLGVIVYDTTRLSDIGKLVEIDKLYEYNIYGDDMSGFIEYINDNTDNEFRNFEELKLWADKNGYIYHKEFDYCFLIKPYSLRGSLKHIVESINGGL